MWGCDHVRVTAPHWTEPGPTPVRLAPAELWVDPERIEGLVGRLRGVVEEVLQLERSLELYAVESPGLDPVSRNAAAQATKMMEHGRQYLAFWRQHLVLTQQALEQQRSAYLAADTTAAERA